MSWKLIQGLFLLTALSLPAEGAQPPDIDPAAVEAFFLSKLEEMISDFDQEHYDRVVRTAEAILELHPGFTQAEKVRALKLKAKDRLIGRNILKAALTMNREECAVGARVTVTCTLTNVHTGRVVLLMNDREDSPWARRGLPFAAAAFEYTETGVRGGVVTDSWQQPLRGIEGTITLGPGKTWRKEFLLDTGTRSPLRATCRTYRVGVTLRPARILVENRTLYRPVVFDAASLTVFPRGYTILKADALGALEEAVEEENAINLFLAAHFVKGEGREAAQARLLAALDEDYDDPGMRRTIIVAIGVLTGQRVPLDLKAFRVWWSQREKEAEKKNGPR